MTCIGSAGCGLDLHAPLRLLQALPDEGGPSAQVEDNLPSAEMQSRTGWPRTMRLPVNDGPATFEVGIYAAPRAA